VEVKFITSISPRRIERQQYCIETWRKYGSVVAVQAVEEIPSLESLFPSVQFVATDRTGVELGYPSRVNIAAMIEHGPGILINSDIKIDTTPRQFAADWSPVSKQFNVGVRYDFDGPGKAKHLCKYGIDAFLITEEIMAVMEDHGFVIGVPVWDYWIIWHAITRGFRIKTKLTPGMLHLNHPMGWSDADMTNGLNIMKRDYGIGQKGLSVAINDITGRLHIKHGRHNTPMETS
jgi:hypothetical protein